MVDKVKGEKKEDVSILTHPPCKFIELRGISSFTIYKVDVHYGEYYLTGYCKLMLSIKIFSIIFAVIKKKYYLCTRKTEMKYIY